MFCVWERFRDNKLSAFNTLLKQYLWIYSYTFIHCFILVRIKLDLELIPATMWEFAPCGPCGPSQGMKHTHPQQAILCSDQHVLGGGKKPENLEKVHTDNLYTENQDFTQTVFWAVYQTKSPGQCAAHKSGTGFKIHMSKIAPVWCMIRSYFMYHWGFMT